MFSFYTDFDIEYDLLLYFLSYPTGNTPRERAAQYNIPDNVFRAVSDGCDNGNVLKTFLQRQYRDNEQKLKEFINRATAIDYTKYLTKLSEIFGYKIPDYKIRINTNHDGTSDWVGTDGVSLRMDFDESEFLHFLMWEVILSQTFQLLRKMPAAADLPDMDSDMSGKSIWGIAEVTAWVITEFSDDFKFQKHTIGYPQLVKYGDAAAKLYSNRSDFKDYLKKVIEYFKNQ